MTDGCLHGSRRLACLIAALALAACGGKGGTADSDASDTALDDPAGDTAADSTSDVDPDSAPDTPSDSTADAEADSTTDTTGDPDADPIEDTSADGDPDTTGDVTGDPFEDWPTDLPPEWPEDTSHECETAGGFCSGARWMLCPAGYEAVAGADPIMGCDVNGWCCVPAPPSTCSASGWTNCVEAASCEDCWDDPGVAGLECEEGRVCCYDICD